ncbi:MAG: cupin domain-containing protein, partial [Selenomonadaceae bacterium]|nr:cupin domain-containing protein [Selenomonadaceae bacterium]
MFPDIIKKVPSRDYGIDGLEVHVDHTSTGTVYFVSAEKEVVFPEHAHAAQWTIVVTGSCTFTANGESKIFSAGETYFIPAGLRHQITLHAGYSEVDYVDDPLDGEECTMENKVIAGLQTIVTELAQQADGHLIQSRIFASQGLSKLAKQYEEHAAEERGYVVKCIDRLIDLGCEVKLEAKNSAPIICDVVEYLKHDLQVSKDGLAWLKEIVCAAQDD